MQRADGTGRVLRLHDALRRLSADGQPLIRGAAGAVSVLCGLEPAADFGVRLASWLDAPGDDLVRLLAGALVAAGPLLATGGAALTPLLDRIESVSDSEFVKVLPAVRGGFDALSPAARDRMLATIRERADGFDGADLDAAPAVGAVGVRPRRPCGRRGPVPGRTVRCGRCGGHRRPRRAAPDVAAKAATAAAELTAADRWRLVLGRQSGELAAAGGRLARALDELYGAGHGEGSRTVDEHRRAAGGGPLPGRAALARRAGRAVRRARCARRCSAGRPRPAGWTRRSRSTRTGPGHRWSCCTPCCAWPAACPRASWPGCARWPTGSRGSWPSGWPTGCGRR